MLPGTIVGRLAFLHPPPAGLPCTRLWRVGQVRLGIDSHGASARRSGNVLDKGVLGRESWWMIDIVPSWPLETYT